MGKWPLALMGVGGVLAAMTMVWLAWGGIGYSTTTYAISLERKDAEKSHDNQQMMEANMYFIERARAIEAGFKAAFPFHK